MKGWKIMANRKPVLSATRLPKCSFGVSPRPLPACIEEIPDPKLKWLAGRTWRAADTFEEAVMAWSGWLKVLEVWQADPQSAPPAAFPECHVPAFWPVILDTNPCDLLEQAGRAANTLGDSLPGTDFQPMAVVGLLPDVPEYGENWRTSYDVKAAREKLTSPALSFLRRELLRLKVLAETSPHVLFATSGRGDASNEQGGADDPDTPLSPAKLADRLGIPAGDARGREALRKRLESWRKKNLDGGWIEARDPKPREPKYLYPLGKVWPLIQDLKPSG
jgi:hypothetical protein